MVTYTRKLPASPDLDHLRREARSLQRAFNKADPEARSRVAQALPRRAGVSSLHLADAQCVVAREYGFASWPRLKLVVEAARDPLKSAIVAVRLGDPDRVKSILGANPGLVTKFDDQNHRPLLHEACCDIVRRNPKRLQVLEVILDAGCDVNVAISDGQTALHYAAGLGMSDVCTFLLDRGADPASVEQRGGTPLHHALVGGCSDAADLLARRGPVDDNLRTAAGLGRLDLIERHFAGDGTLKPSAGQHRGWTSLPWLDEPERSDDPAAILVEALAYAVRNERVEAARRLVEAGARFDADAMTSVATSGHAELVDLMLSTDPDLARPLEWDWAIWQWAQFAGHEELGKRLKRLAALKHLPTAAALGRVDLVEKLLEQGADPSQTDHDGATALALALGVHAFGGPPSEGGGSAEVAARIAAVGGTLDFPSAAKLGRLDELERHLRAGADPEAALGVAVEARQLRVIERLVAAGAKVDIFDAARLGWSEQVLAQLTDDFDWYSTKRNGTLLFMAVWSGSYELVQALLERGAPLNISATGGASALHIAAWAGADEAMWDLLLRYGGDINGGSDPGTPYDCARMAIAHKTMAIIRARGGLSRKELEAELEAFPDTEEEREG